MGVYCFFYFSYTGDHDGLTAEWFTRLWQDDHNHEVNCSCLPDIDFEKWREEMFQKVPIA